MALTRTDTRPGPAPGWRLLGALPDAPDGAAWVRVECRACGFLANVARERLARGIACPRCRRAARDAPEPLAAPMARRYGEWDVLDRRGGEGREVVWRVRCRRCGAEDDLPAGRVMKGRAVCPRCAPATAPKRPLGPCPHCGGRRVRVWQVRREAGDETTREGWRCWGCGKEGEGR